MNKQQFFLEAMRAQMYRSSPWVIQAFSQSHESPDAWKKDPFAYRIVATPAGFFYVDPNDTTRLQPIEGAAAGQALYHMKERVNLHGGEIENLSTACVTTYGNILANYLLLIYPFGKKFPFLNTRFDARKLEEQIAERFVELPEIVDPKIDPADSLKHRDINAIYVDEVLRFNDAAMSLAAFTQLCVPACSEKSITPPPGIKEYRAKLLMENKDRLHDPAIIAMIDKKLVEYHKQYMKGDIAEGFLITNKSWEVVRKELYLMGGAAAGLDDSGKFDLVDRSLVEGWDPQHFAVMNTVSRAGSFSRGAETEKGGEETKWLFRASSNMTVTEENCGSTLGVDIVATPGNERRLVGFTAIKADGNQVKITNDNVGEYMGRKVWLRSSLFCRLPKTDFCKVCVGERLANNPTGLSTAVAAYGSTFMDTAMSAMHATALKTTRLDYTSAFC